MLTRALWGKGGLQGGWTGQIMYNSWGNTTLQRSDPTAAQQQATRGGRIAVRTAAATLMQVCFRGRGAGWMGGLVDGKFCLCGACQGDQDPYGRGALGPM